MRKINTLIVIPIFSLSCVALLAQDPAGPVTPDKGNRPARMKRGLDKIDPRKMKEDLTTTLNLDQSQQSDVERILGAHKQKLSDLRRQFAETSQMGEQWTKLREDLKVARAEMTQAKTAQDQAKITEAQAKMDGLMSQITTLRKEDEERRLPLRKAQEEAKISLKGEVLGILREDQKAKFETYWAQQMEPQSDRYRGPARSPQALKAMIDRMAGISSDQKTQLDNLFRQYHETEKTNAANPAANEAQVKKLYDDVLNVLTPEQRQEIEQKLAGGRRRTPGPGGAQPETTKPHEQPKAP